MKVQNVPVKLPENGNTGTKGASAEKTDFLSILKTRTVSGRDPVKGEKEPLKKTDKKKETEKKSDAYPKTSGEAERLGGQLSQENQAQGTENEAVREVSDITEAEQISAVETAALKNALGGISDPLTVFAQTYSQKAGEETVLQPADGNQPDILSGESAGMGAAGSETVRKSAEQAGADGMLELLRSGTSQKDVSEGMAAGTFTQTVSETPERKTLNEALSGNRGEVSSELKPEILKTSETVGKDNQPQSGMDGSGQNGKDTEQWFSLDHTARGARAVKSTEESGQQGSPGEVSLEELQKKAEKNVYLPFERMIGARLAGSQTVKAAGNQNVTETIPLTEQLRAGIEQGIKRELSQFTIRLKPEGLGEILVHMTSAGGKIALSIGVSSHETQKLLSGEMMHLKETLEPLHAEVQEIYHNSQGGMDMMSYEQGFFRNQQQDRTGTVRRNPVRAGDAEEEDGAENLKLEEIGLSRAEYGRLSAYI